MDWGTIIVQVTAIIGAIAAMVAIYNGIDELREKRRKRRAMNEVSITKDTPPSSSEPPAVASVGQVVPNAPPTRRLANLPTQLTELIGRDEELAQIKNLLLRPDVRLVTLTGPAGIGKTRLALEAGADLLDRFPDGVFFVALASVTDPDLVLPTVTQALEMHEQGSEPLLEMLEDYLQEKHLLLLLDNLEQVVAAVPMIAPLLAAAPKLEILATSREVLHLYGEHAFEVPPLTLPDPEHLPGGTDLVAALTAFEAVRLFVERAEAAGAGFALTRDNARAVAEICHRLDGLPLSIELAAARVRLLSPDAMLERLRAASGGSALELLTGGARDLPPRQRTLRSTIAWSYDLLDEAEQILFQRLGVFSGGWTLEAAEQIAGGSSQTGISMAEEDSGSNLQPPGVDVLAGLESLVDKSLVRQVHADGNGRFIMLQTIREYALERLEDAGLAEAVRRAHATWYLTLTEQAEPKLYRIGQMAWLKRLETEHDNLRAALRWALDAGHSELALRLAGNLAWFWLLHGSIREGRGWLESALSSGQSAPPETRAKALLGLADLVSNQADWPTAWAALEESTGIARKLGDHRLLSRGLATLSLFKVRGAAADGADAQALADESLALARSLGDPWSLGYVLTVLDIRNLLLGDTLADSTLSEEALAQFEATGDQWGMVLANRHIGMRAIATGDYAAARAAAERGLAASQGLGDKMSQAYTLNALGDITRLQEDYDAAAAYYEEALALYREIGLKADIPASLHNLGWMALARGEVAKSQSLQAESLRLHSRGGNKAGMIEALSGLAAVARATGDLTRAARLFGASEALRTSIGAPLWPGERAERERQIAALRAQLDEAALAAAWAEGRTLTLEQAAAEALNGTAPANEPAQRDPAARKEHHS